MKLSTLSMLLFTLYPLNMHAMRFPELTFDSHRLAECISNPFSQVMTEQEIKDMISAVEDEVTDISGGMRCCVTKLYQDEMQELERLILALISDDQKRSDEIDTNQSETINNLIDVYNQSNPRHREVILLLLKYGNLYP